jgi:hypothetical protein
MEMAVQKFPGNEEWLLRADGLLMVPDSWIGCENTEKKLSTLAVRLINRIKAG